MDLIVGFFEFVFPLESEKLSLAGFIGPDLVLEIFDADAPEVPKRLVLGLDANFHPMRVKQITLPLRKLSREIVATKFLILKEIVRFFDVFVTLK